MAGEITPEEKAFGQKLETEWIDRCAYQTVQQQVKQQINSTMAEVQRAGLLKAEKLKMSPRPIRTLTPDDPYGLKPRIKKPSRLKKLLARLGGHKSAKNI